MASFDYRLNTLYPIKECSSCGALYTMDYCCSDGSLRDKIICDLNKTPNLSQRLPQNCPKCRNLVDGQYCQGCALLRKKFKEDLFTYCIENGILQDFQDTSESFNENTNVANALQEPFFPVIHQPIRKKTCAELLAEEQEATVLSLAWETILEIELAFEDKHCQPEDILELFRRLHNDVQNIHEELAVYINTLSWDRPTICYNDDDDEDCTIAITFEEPDNSLSMRDEHLDTILTTESDEFIKSSVGNLVPIPSESEGIPDNMYNVPFHDNSPPLDISKDQFEDFFNSNDDYTSIDDYSFYIDNIEYVEASPPDSEIVSSKVIEIVIPEVGGIDADILLIIKDNIISFYVDHVKEISSGSTTTYSDFSLYDSFIFDFLINPFPPADRSDFYHEEFTDELAHIISPPKYDCFCFKNEPDSGDFTVDVEEDTFPTRE
nr:hypothetical protein [Tanacetum cinerariifolium]